MTAATDVGVDLGEAPRCVRSPSRLAALDADVERHLAEIGAYCSPAALLWVASLLDRIEPVDQRGFRDAAIREVVLLSSRGSISGSCKEAEARLRRYVIEAYPGDVERGAPPDGCSAIRLAMFNAVRFNGGDGLAWRQILNIAER